MNLRTIIQKIASLLRRETSAPTQAELPIQPTRRRRSRKPNRHVRGDTKTIQGETRVFWQYYGTREYWPDVAQYNRLVEADKARAIRRHGGAL